MQFASDNAGPVHPRIMEAVLAANDGHASPYGAEAAMVRVRDHVREVFEAPQAAVYLVATGTAANALILATMCRPWQTIYCARHAHIHEDECAAPEFFTGGAKLTLVDGPGGTVDPDSLRATMEAGAVRGVHGVQRGPVSITQATERGEVYAPDQVAAIGEVARAFGVPLHMDGARFANALVAAGCSPAEMTWRAGVDALSLGATKNGCMGVEAAVFFRPEAAWEFELRRKRGAHLFSKHRYLSAQMEAYLADDLWLDLARAANGACARLAEGLAGRPQVRLHRQPRANMIFADFPRRLHRRLKAGGAQYYVWTGDLAEGDPEAPLTARLVCDWSAEAAEADRFLSHFETAAAAAAV